MIGDEVIQATVVEKLKLLSPFGGVTSAEVRELSWQGDAFTYPNIRVDLESNEWVFDEQERCNLQYVTFSVYIFSEQRSSKECSQIKTIIINDLVGLGFTSTTHQVKFSRLRMVDNIPAIREDANTWRSQVQFGSRISNP